MKFSTITALAVLGSNAFVAAYEIPNNKVIGKIVDEYLEQDPERGEWSQECRDESAGVQVCVVAAVTADPAWGTRVGQAGETLEACTKGWTITDQAEWEKCLTPYFTLLSEKCDLSASLEACFGEDVHFIADFVDDLELDMIAAEVVADEFEEDDGEDGDDSFELPEGCEEEWDKVEVCIGEAGEADPAWLAALTSAEEEVSACITALYEAENITAESVAACMEDATVLLQQKCDTTAAEEACTPSEILDFHLDLVEDLKLDMIEQAVFLQEDPVGQCDVEWENLLTCIDAAASDDEAWAATYEAAVDTFNTCSEGLVESDQEGWEDCITPWFMKVSEKCEIDTFFAACDGE